MPFGIGIDLADVEEVQASLTALGERYLRRVFTEREIADCQGRPERLAERFAVKEALLKALGSGVEGVSWRSVDVVEHAGRRWSVELHGSAAELAEQCGVQTVAVSVTHQRGHAAAVVLVEMRPA